jgi:AcrR family transcriptional regulator
MREMKGRMPESAATNRGLSGPTTERDRKTEICEKARGIFIRYGYRKTTVEEIGNACGLRKGALYHYFANKEEIFAAVVRRESARILGEMRNAVEACDDPREQLAAMVRTRFEAFRKIVVDSGMGKDLGEMLPLARSVRQDYFRMEVEMLADILRRGVKRGVFRPIRSMAVPLVIISALQGIETHFAEVQNAPAIDEGLDELLELLIEGICKHKGASR